MYWSGPGSLYTARGGDILVAIPNGIKVVSAVEYHEQEAIPLLSGMMCNSGASISSAMIEFRTLLILILLPALAFTCEFNRPLTSPSCLLRELVSDVQSSEAI